VSLDAAKLAAARRAHLASICADMVQEARRRVLLFFFALVGNHVGDTAGMEKARREERPPCTSDYGARAS